MTLQSFGNATPVQIDMLALVGYEPHERDMVPAATKNARELAMIDGLRSLMQTTNADFGYDARAWRDYLIDSGSKFGYTHPYAFHAVDRAVFAALQNPEVLASLESLNDRTTRETLRTDQ